MINQGIRSIQQKKAENARVADQQAGVNTINGLFMVSGAGEASISVNFPVKFMERPLMTFGAELDPSSIAVPGQYPTLNVVVGEWLIEGPVTKRYFVGAKLLIVSTGPAVQKLWGHWSATGKATTNPFN